MPPLGDVVAVLALACMLAVAFLHPSARLEAMVALACTGTTLATGLLSSAEVRTALEDLAPVVAFLITILVVSDVCSRAGLFTAAAQRVSRWGGDRPTRLFAGIFVLAAVVTVVLSLDATVVLLTPVVLAVGLSRESPTEPGTYACLRMANSASLLLPVSNLTNLLAMPHLDFTFTGFAVHMAPVLAVVLVVEYVGLRLLFRAQLESPPAPATRPERLDPLPVFPVVVVVLMLVGFAVVSPFGIQPWWVSLAAALVLAVWARRQRLQTATEAVRAANPAFALWVLALGVVVAALAQGFLGDLVEHTVPSSTSFLALLLIAVVATVLANVLTNLSATLLFVPLLAGLGTPGILAALLGLNIGSGLTWTGSLANLLWRRTLVHHGAPAGTAAFHRVSVVLTPISLVAAVTALWLTT